MGFRSSIWIFLRTNAHPCGLIDGGACKFEVVYINDHHQLQFSVPKTRSPIGNGNESGLHQNLVAMLLPTGTGVRVTVQGKSQRANRIVKSLGNPCFRPSILWQSDPCFGSGEFGLDISLFSIRLHDGVSAHQAVSICSLRSLH